MAKFYCFFPVAAVLSLCSGDGHAVNTQSGSGQGAAKLKIIADFRDIVQHVFEITGHGNFLDRESEFAVLDPETTGATGKIARNHVHAEAEELRHIEPLFD